MTVSGFLEHLEHARYRVSLLIALALAASLAWWVAGKSEAAIPLFENVVFAEKDISSSSRALDIELERLASWLEESDPAPIEQATSKLQQLGDTLGIRGAAEALSFFSLSNEFEVYLGAWSRLRLHQLPHDWKQWTQSQCNDFVTLANAYSQPASEKKSISDIRKVLLSAQLLDGQSPQVKQGMDALEALDTGLRHATKKKAVEPTEIPKALGLLTKAMEDMGLNKVSSVLKVQDARAARRALELGSLDAAGFSIPGLAIRLLVPLTALAISIDLLLCLCRISKLATQYLTRAEVAMGLSGLPWLFSPPDIGADGRLKSVALAKIFALLAATSFALVPLVLSGTAGLQKLFGLLCLVATLVIQVFCVRSLALFHGAASEPQTKTDETVRGKLASQRMKAASSALTGVLIACAATLAFFLAFSLIPRHLQGDNAKLHKEAKVLQVLESSYGQRLREQPQIFVEWCKGGCEPWVLFSFAAEQLAEDHPAKSLLKLIASDPIVKAQAQTMARMPDLIGESLARFEDLDPEDVGLVVELLYRENYDSVVEKLTQLQRVLATNPAPEIAAYLPKSVTEQPVSGISPPFVAPYRVIVERGGFADLLRPLPPPGDVEALLSSINEMGASRVVGFKTYEGELAGLDAELGRVHLKLAGVTVPQVVARDVALISLCLLSLVLAGRIRGVRLLMVDIQARQDEPKANTDNSPGVLFLNSTSWPRRWRWLPTVHIFVGVLVTEMVVLSAPGTSSVHQFFPIFCAVVTLFAVTWAAMERQGLLRFTYENMVDRKNVPEGDGA